MADSVGPFAIWCLWYRNPAGRNHVKESVAGLKNEVAHFQAPVPHWFRCLTILYHGWTTSSYTRKKLRYWSGWTPFCPDAIHTTGNYQQRSASFLKASQMGRLCYRCIGYKRDPRSTEALRNMYFPIFFDELCQLNDCCRWMSRCVPKFPPRIWTFEQDFGGRIRTLWDETQNCAKRNHIIQASPVLNLWNSLHPNQRNIAECCTVSALEGRSRNFGIHGCLG